MSATTPDSKAAGGDPRGILVVDLGAQYAQLIARRVREAHVWSEIVPPAQALERAAQMNLGGVILSGGPASVYGADAPQIPAGVLELGVPVLGICYGMQWMMQVLGGDVQGASEREFGRTSIAVARPHELFEGVGGNTVVWMSHGDKVAAVPDGFVTYASSSSCEFAAVGDVERGFFGVQFHPEVTHSVRGRDLIENFVWRVCDLAGGLDPRLDRRARGRADPRAGGRGR